jgi:midasin
MNPATDVGKKDLPLGLRSRFTELYVESPDKALTNLLDVVKAYLGSFNTLDERAAHDISRLYLKQSVSLTIINLWMELTKGLILVSEH